MKERRYLGGMLVFHLPDSWKEERFSDSSAYYEGEAENGSLNVSLTTIENPAGVDEGMLREVANMGREAGDAEAEPLPSGNYLRRFERGRSSEANLHATFWLVASMVPPRTVRYAIFNYGAPPQVTATEAYKACIAMLDEQIRLTTFTTLTPEQTAALRRANRPWWQFW